MDKKRGYVTGIFDSDEKVRNKIKLYIERFERDYKIQFEVYIYELAEELLNTNIEFDIIILDTGLDGMSGIELAHNIRKMDKHVLLVFISACIDYVLDAFRVQAFRFLIKPVTYEQFVQEILDASNVLKDRKQQYLEIRQNGIKRNIQTKDVIYIESQHNKINIHIDGRIIEVTQTLKSVLKNNERHFCQVHKCYIVNLRHYCFRKKYELHLKYGYIIPISRYRINEFEEKYIAYCKNFI